ncbi:hypothetical protein ACWDHH_04430 [Janibacter hoylei]
MYRQACSTVVSQRLRDARQESPRRLGDLGRTSAVPGVVSGREVRQAMTREHGLGEGKVKQWAVDQPIYREDRTWVVQTNAWSKQRIAKLAEGLEGLTDGAVEVTLDSPTDEGI